MGCLTLVSRICSMNKDPHIRSHVWIPGIKTRVWVSALGPGIWVLGPGFRYAIFFLFTLIFDASCFILCNRETFTSLYFFEMTQQFLKSSILISVPCDLYLNVSPKFMLSVILSDKYMYIYKQVICIRYVIYIHRGVWGVVKHIQFEESNIYTYNHIFSF